MTTEQTIAIVVAELKSAEERFPAMRSAHEGYAILQEEVDELWQEIKHGSAINMQKEAIQVAAMALRFLKDCCPGGASLVSFEETPVEKLRGARKRAK